jgi:hypothetical protein
VSKLTCNDARGPGTTPRQVLGRRAQCLNRGVQTDLQRREGKSGRTARCPNSPRRRGKCLERLGGIQTHLKRRRGIRTHLGRRARHPNSPETTPRHPDSPVTTPRHPDSPVTTPRHQDSHVTTPNHPNPPQWTTRVVSRLTWNKRRSPGGIQTHLEQRGIQAHLGRRARHPN